MGPTAATRLAIAATRRTSVPAVDHALALSPGTHSNLVTCLPEVQVREFTFHLVAGPIPTFESDNSPAVAHQPGYSLV